MVSVKTLSLELSDCEESSIERLRHLLPKVIAIDVALRDEWYTEKGLRHICQNFRGLQRLKISDRDSWLIRRINSLRVLQHLEHLEELTFMFIRTRIIDIPPNVHLKRFVMHYPEQLSNDDLLELARQYPNLRYLQLGPNRQVTSEGIEAFRKLNDSLQLTRQVDFA